MLALDGVLNATEYTSSSQSFCKESTVSLGLPLILCNTFPRAGSPNAIGGHKSLPYHAFHGYTDSLP